MSRETIDIIFREQGGREVRRRIDDIQGSSGRAQTAVGLLTRALGVIGAGLTIRSISRTADAYTELGNRIRLVTDTEAELIDVRTRLFDISNRTRASIEVNADLYNRLALSSKDLNTSQAELLQVTESLNQAVIISGASATESAAGLIQLSQGLASGALRGDELRSVLEQLPAVADVIATSLGVTRGELRTMGEQGAITAEVVLNAFREAREELDERFAQTVPTISQSFTVLRNNGIELVGTLDEIAGTSSFASRFIVGLGDDVRDLTRAIDAGEIAVNKVTVAAGALLAVLGLAGVLAVLGPLAFVIGEVAAALLLIAETGAIVPVLGAWAAGFHVLTLSVTGSVAALGVFGTAALVVAVPAALAVLAHYVAEWTGLQQVLNDVVSDPRINVFWGRVTRAEDELRQSIERTADALRARGIEVDLTNKSLDEQHAAIATASQGLIAHALAAREDARAQALLRGEVVELGVEAKKQRDQFIEAVTRSAGIAAPLADALRQLEEASTPTQLIIEALGDTSVEAARQLQLLGDGVPPLIRKYADLTLAAEATVEAQERIEEVLGRFQSLRSSLDPVFAARQEFAEAFQTVSDAAAADVGTYGERVAALEAASRRLQRALHPEDAVLRGLDDELRLLQLSTRERQIQARLEQELQSLREAGAPEERLFEVTPALREQLERLFDIQQRPGLQKAVLDLQESISGVDQAVRQVVDAEALLFAAEAAGLVNAETRADVLARISERLRDQLDPIGAINRQIAIETELLALNTRERRIELEVRRAMQDLERSGIPVSEQLEAALRDQFAALAAANEEARARDEIFRFLRGAEEDAIVRQAELNRLFREGAISAEEFARAARRIELSALADETALVDGLRRGILRVQDDIADLSTEAERLLVGTFRRAEDALAQFAATGQFDFSRLVQSMIADLTRLAAQDIFRRLFLGEAGGGFGGGGLIGLIGGVLGGVFGGGGGFQTWSSRGIPAPPPPGFEHGGSFTVGGVGARDSQLVRFMASPGERVTVEPKGTTRRAPEVHVHFHGVQDADSFRRSRGQIAAQIGATVDRAIRRNG